MSVLNSGLPTLMRKGFVVPPKGWSESDKKKLENMISVDYILNYIADRIPLKKGSPPKISAKKYGDKVIILKADTGSGKSTALPAKLYTTFFERTHKNIIVTQPRIFNAIDIPSSIVSFTPELELDKNIGYSTGSFKRPPKEKGLLFCTVGVLTQQFIMKTEEEIMRAYQFIIIDEVHERDIETDMCLFMIKKFLQNNYDDPECPIIILTSATFNETIFIDYFDVPQQNYIQVIGSTFTIEAIYPEYSIANYVNYAIHKAQKIHLENLDELSMNGGSKFRDIIIFIKDTKVGEKIYEDMHAFNSEVLTKPLNKIIEHIHTLDIELQNSIKKPYDEIEGGDDDHGLYKNYYILPILLDKTTFEAGGLEYQNLFSNLESIHVPIWNIVKQKGHKKIDFSKVPYKYATPTRRVIIATNLAETGVTIPTLKYCIDTGYYLNIEFNPNIGCNIRYAKNVMRSMAIQRRGRVGRKAPGIWYPCYTKKTFESLPAEQFSKIVISDTTENLLGILIKEKNAFISEELSIKKINDHKAHRLFQMFRLADNSWYKMVNLLPTNLSALDFIEMPSAQSISYSIEKLHILGFIDDNYDITLPGYYANQIRFLNLETRRMILAGYCHGANILDLITIASFIYVSRRKIFADSFRMVNFLKQNDIDFEFYNRVLFADDFLNCIFIWNIFQAFIQKSLSALNIDILDKIDNSRMLQYKKILYSDDVKKWCEDHGILYIGLTNVIAIRDQIIANMITLGLDPYKNSLDISKNTYNLNKILLESLADGLNEIKKLKWCFYEGFKCNLMTRSRFSYTLLIRNIQVNIKSPYTAQLNENIAEQKKPIYVLADSYTLSQSPRGAQFEFNADGFISVLDNFVEVDPNFYSH